jgi:hypothetical protein
LRGPKTSCQTGDFPKEIDRHRLPLLPPGIYGGLFFNHFGHFLTESLGRLWAVNEADPELVSLPIYVFQLWGKIDLSDDGFFVTQTLQLLGIDMARIIIIDRPSIITTLTVPQQKYGFHLAGHPSEDFVRFLRNAQSRISSVEPNLGHLRRRVYVSRAQIDPSRGKAAGEHRFQQFLEEQGYQTFYPEQHCLIQQLAVYLNAEKLIFCEGSALHACILLPHIQADVAIILRQKESGIADQFEGFGKKVLVIQAVLKQQTFGLPPWHGVTTIDYFECSRLLLDNGFVSGCFEGWGDIVQMEEEAALAAYVRAVAEDHRLLSFLTAAEAGTHAAGTRRTETEAQLEAVLASASWRITAPLRRLSRFVRHNAGIRSHR